MSKQAEPKLNDIQAWLHTFVVQPGTTEEALAAAEAKAGFASGSAEELVLPSPTLAPKERIQIYRRMYLLRMYDALEIDFPTIAERLGPEPFRKVVANYVESHPSQSYTLDHLGRDFAAFIKHETDLSHSEALAELAQLEWSLCVVAIAENSPSLGLEALASVEPDSFLELTFTPINALQLWQFEYNVNSYYSAWSRDEELPELEKSPTNLVVWRQNLRAWRRELSTPAYTFLSHLVGGLCLGQALDRVIEGSGQSEEQLFEWFQGWVGDGLFSNFTLRHS